MSISFPPAFVPNALGVGSNFIAPNLTSTGMLVSAGMYPAVTEGAANFGPTAGQTSIDLLNYCHIGQIRQNGTIEQFKVAVPATTGITGFYLKIWRADNGNFDLVGVSTNLASSLVSGEINTLATNIPGVQEGDYIGLRVEYSGGASAQVLVTSAIPNFSGNNQPDGAIYSVLNATPGTSQYNWLGQTANASLAVLTEVDMPAPIGILIGDSRASGYPTTVSFCDSRQQQTDITADSAFPLFHALGYTFQNMGIGSQTTTAIADRFATDAIGLHPRVIILQGFGVNNLIQNGTGALSQMETDATTVLNMAEAAGIPMIVVGDTPWRNYSGASTALLATDNTYNAWLKNLIETSYPNAAYIDPYPLLGQYAAADAAGNLNALREDYDSGDGLHPNRLGYSVLAAAALNLIAQAPFNGQLAVSGIRLNGDVVASGDSARYIRQLRSSLTDMPGSLLGLEAAGAAVASTNQNGGTLSLSGGAATGSGSSSVTLNAALAGSSGTSDIAPSVGLALTGANGIPQVVIGHGVSVPANTTTTLELHGATQPVLDFYSDTGNYQSQLFSSSSGLGINTFQSTPISFFPDLTLAGGFTSQGLVVGNNVFDAGGIQLEVYNATLPVLQLFGAGADFRLYANSTAASIATATNTPIEILPDGTLSATFTSQGLVVGNNVFDASGIQLEVYNSSTPVLQLFGNGTDFRLYTSSTNAYLATASNTNINIQPHSTTVLTATPTGVNITGTLGLTVATWADNQTVTAGQISIDANYIYVATAANTVKRVALSSF